MISSKRWHRNTRISGRQGQLWIGRRPADTLVKAAAFEARRVAELLRAAGWTVPVTAVITVHDARLLRWGVLTVSGVTLLRASRVYGWILRRPARLDDGQVASPGAAAERLFPPYAPSG
ncbi:hypothetical protein [Nonomuraea sp. NPDC049784]|uniref:hypothetical protein n=1 Tax=Nonomuraea sp. NPDC049784 TaxID=3154361 RepID=UPI00340FB7C4